MHGVKRLVSALSLVLWIVPLAVHAGDVESVDIDEALGAVLPALGLGAPSRGSLGDFPMPRVCARFAHQIARNLKLAERAARVGDRVLEGRLEGQIQLIEGRAASKCPQLHTLVDAAMDPEAIASSQICLRYAFQIAHYENMADRAEMFRVQVGAERADEWREQTLFHSKRLREVATSVCPELEDDAVKKAKEFAKLMKLAAKTAFSYFTMGAFPF